MSLSVNLILPEEQRSGGKINPKSMIKILAFAGPMLALVLILQQALSYFVLQTNLSIKESRWQAAEPRQTEASRLQARLNQNLQINNEINAWRNTSPGWDSAILALMGSTPENIHITNVRMQALPADNQAAGGSPPSRSPSMLMEGRVSEPDAMVAIESLRAGLEAHPILKDSIKTAEVIHFAADSQALGTSRRVFSIRVIFKDLP
jgi:hypothetical protein